MPISIAIVDDHRVVARSLQAFLESFPDLRLVGTATSGEQLLARLDEWRPQVILQDLLLPGGLDGIATTRRVLERAPQTRVIALTASVDEDRMTGVLSAGAAGYVRKNAEPETLLVAIRAVARGQTFIDSSIRPLAGRMPDELTRRERDVLRGLALGQSNREIASRLDIGEETVKTHVKRLLAKLGVENRSQAAVRALVRGVVSSQDLPHGDRR